MASRQTDDKPLFEPMGAYFTDACMCVPLGLNELNSICLIIIIFQDHSSQLGLVDIMHGIDWLFSDKKVFNPLSPSDTFMHYHGFIKKIACCQAIAKPYSDLIIANRIPWYKFQWN